MTAGSFEISVIQETKPVFSHPPPPTNDNLLNFNVEEDNENLDESIISPLASLSTNNHLLLTPDGKYILTGGTDGYFRLWARKNSNMLMGIGVEEQVHTTKGNYPVLGISLIDYHPEKGILVVGYLAEDSVYVLLIKVISTEGGQFSTKCEEQVVFCGVMGCEPQVIIARARREAETRVNSFDNLLNLYLIECVLAFKTTSTNWRAILLNISIANGPIIDDIASSTSTLLSSVGTVKLWGCLGVHSGEVLTLAIAPDLDYIIALEQKGHLLLFELSSTRRDVNAVNLEMQAESFRKPIKTFSLPVLVTTKKRSGSNMSQRIKMLWDRELLVTYLGHEIYFLANKNVISKDGENSLFSIATVPTMYGQVIVNIAAIEENRLYLSMSETGTAYMLNVIKSNTSITGKLVGQPISLLASRNDLIVSMDMLSIFDDNRTFDGQIAVMDNEGQVRTVMLKIEIGEESEEDIPIDEEEKLQSSLEKEDKEKENKEENDFRSKLLKLKTDMQTQASEANRKSKNKHERGKEKGAHGKSAPKGKKKSILFSDEDDNQNEDIELDISSMTEEEQDVIEETDDDNDFANDLEEYGAILPKRKKKKSSNEETEEGSKENRDKIEAQILHPSSLLALSPTWKHPIIKPCSTPWKSIAKILDWTPDARLIARKTTIMPASINSSRTLNGFILPQHQESINSSLKKIALEVEFHDKRIHLIPIKEELELTVSENEDIDLIGSLTRSGMFILLNESKLLRFIPFPAGQFSGFSHFDSELMRSPFSLQPWSIDAPVATKFQLIASSLSFIAFVTSNNVLQVMAVSGVTVGVTSVCASTLVSLCMTEIRRQSTLVLVACFHDHGLVQVFSFNHSSTGNARINLVYEGWICQWTNQCFLIWAAFLHQSDTVDEDKHYLDYKLACMDSQGVMHALDLRSSNSPWLPLLSLNSLCWPISWNNQSLVAICRDENEIAEGCIPGTIFYPEPYPVPISQEIPLSMPHLSIDSALSNTISSALTLQANFGYDNNSSQTKKKAFHATDKQLLHTIHQLFTSNSPLSSNFQQVIDLCQLACLWPKTIDVVLNMAKHAQLSITLISQLEKLKEIRMMAKTEDEFYSRAASNSNNFHPSCNTTCLHSVHSLQLDNKENNLEINQDNESHRKRLLSGLFKKNEVSSSLLIQHPSSLSSSNLVTSDTFLHKHVENEILTNDLFKETIQTITKDREENGSVVSINLIAKSEDNSDKPSSMVGDFKDLVKRMTRK